MVDGMNLDSHHAATVEKIFQHPVSHNIEWHDVLSLLEGVGEVTKEHDGRYKVTLGSETETFDVPPRQRHRRAAGRRPAPDAASCRDNNEVGLTSPGASCAADQSLHRPGHAKAFSHDANEPRGSGGTFAGRS